MAASTAAYGDALSRSVTVRGEQCPHNGEHTADEIQCGTMARVRRWGICRHYQCPHIPNITSLLPFLPRVQDHESQKYRQFADVRTVRGRVMSALDPDKAPVPS